MGGAEVLRLSILEELLKDESLSIRVCVLRKRGELADQVEAMGIPLDVLGNRGGLFDFAGVRRLATYFRQHRPTIVQSSQFLTNLHTNLAARLAKVPVVVIEEHGVYTWKKWYHRLIDRRINSRANAVVACSHCVAESAAAHLNIPAANVTVIHNCVGRIHFQKGQGTREAFRQSMQTSNSALVATCVGTLRWEKGHRFLLEAWGQLIAGQSIPQDSELWIVGSGPLENELRGLSSELPGVRFLGSRSDTAEILRASDLFVLPSVNEGFGIAIVEAMSAKLAVISTNSGGIPEVIESGRTGILVEPENSRQLADSIATLCQNYSQRKQLAAAAQLDAQSRFTPARYVKQLQNLYKSLQR